MRRKIRNSAAFLLGLVGLQQCLFWVGQFQPLRAQKELIIKSEIDPAAFFYTECDQALKAEKDLRKTLAGQ